MLQKLADFTLPLAVMLLTLSLPGNVVAGPPEKMSSKMTFDTVADGLRKYQKEKDEEKRSEWLEKVGIRQVTHGLQSPWVRPLVSTTRFMEWRATC